MPEADARLVPLNMPLEAATAILIVQPRGAKSLAKSHITSKRRGWGLNSAASRALFCPGPQAVLTISSIFCILMRSPLGSC